MTKRRNTKVPKYNSGIPFTYGPRSYFLRNRIFAGETHHSGKWFKGEHETILDRKTFDGVQELLKTNCVRKTKPSPSSVLLKGKFFDDRGNPMGPSFSSKNGVRYRFYASLAMLRGRKASAGSVGRVAAPEIERAVLAALQTQRGGGFDSVKGSIEALFRDKLLITIAGSSGIAG